MDGIDGMETARKLRSQNYKGYLIFITVLKEMVFQAFEVQAYDYLVKPIEEEILTKKWRDYLLPCKMPMKQTCLFRKDTRAILFPLMTSFFVKL